MPNLSQIKRDRMLSFLQKIRKEYKDDESLIAINEIENALIEKKYGLIWEQHEEEIDIKMRTHFPVFEEIKNMEIRGNSNIDNYNFLLEGDNLHSLKLLEKTHGEKISVIYIDPPYNTGNKDFRYNDNYIGIDDTFKHSMWLSFMNERLLLARRLLKRNGVIFISIDNNEFAQLKLLCDSVFGEECFVTNIHVELSATQGMKVKAAKEGNLVKNAEYILVYSKDGHKNIGKNVLYDYRPEYDSHYTKYLTEDMQVKNLIDVFNENSNIKVKNVVEAYAINNDFKVFVEENLDKIFRYDKTTGFNAEDFELNKVVSLEKNNRIYFLERKNNSVEQLMFLKDSYGFCDNFKQSFGLRKIRGDWWKEFYLDMGNVSKEGDMVFANGKKPIRLIKQLLYFATEKDDIILDFFAGSGSTGHAVLDLNKEDGGSRKFILCTDNQNDICETVTYKRLHNVIKGYLSTQGIPANLKYYKTDFIEKRNDDEFYSVSEELQKHIKEMVQLEKGISIEDDNYILLLGDEEADELEKNPDRLKNCKGIYISSGVFLTDTQEKMLQNIPIETIPDYFFESELREVGEL